MCVKEREMFYKVERDLGLFCNFLLLNDWMPFVTIVHQPSTDDLLNCTRLSKSTEWDLAGVAQWVEPQNITSSIPGEGTCLVCGPDPHLWVCKR